MSKGNILITGASTGIGAACAEKFINEGYVVYGSVRKQADADRLLNQFGDNFRPLIFDVANKDEIVASALKLQHEIPSEGLKLLINNAGIAVTGPVESLEVEAFRRQYEVNFFGLIAVTKAFLPLLGAINDCPFDPGKIINMSSIASKRSMPFMTPYASSKAAVDSFTEGLRRELLIYGIDVVTINPGPIETPIWGKIDLTIDESTPTVYDRALKRILKIVNKESENAIPSADLAQIVYKTFLSISPMTSNVIIKNKFLKYTLLSLVPDRIIDRFVKKILKM